MLWFRVTLIAFLVGTFSATAAGQVTLAERIGMSPRRVLDKYMDALEAEDLDGIIEYSCLRNDFGSATHKTELAKKLLKRAKADSALVGLGMAPLQWCPLPGELDGRIDELEVEYDFVLVRPEKGTVSVKAEVQFEREHGCWAVDRAVVMSMHLKRGNDPDGPAVTEERKELTPGAVFRRFLKALEQEDQKAMLLYGGDPNRSLEDRIEWLGDLCRKVQDHFGPLPYDEDHILHACPELNQTHETIYEIELECDWARRADEPRQAARRVRVEFEKVAGAWYVVRLRG